MSSSDIYNAVSGADLVSATDAAGSLHFGTGGVIAVTIIIFILIMVALELLRSRYVLSVNRQIVTMHNLPLSFDGTKVIVLSDLHQMRFGEYNEELAKRIRREKPGYIFFVGDMGDSVKYDVDAFYDFLEAIGSDIPVIMVPGEHDLRLGNGSVHKNFLSEIERAGAVVLSNSCAEMVSNDEKLYVYGFCQSLQDSKKTAMRERELSEIEKGTIHSLLGRCPSDAPVILLAHDPKPFAAYENWGASLVLAGHLCGGIVRLPFGGGLFSPSGEFNPKYTAGLYKRGGCKMFVTRGLGSASKMPRFFNAPEIAVLTLVRPDSKILEQEEQKSKIDARSGFQFAAVKDWFNSEFRSARDLIDERLSQIRDFFALMFGKKRDRFAHAADEKKRRNTYIAPDKRKSSSHRNSSSYRYMEKNSRERRDGFKNR